MKENVRIDEMVFPPFEVAAAPITPWLDSTSNRLVVYLSSSGQQCGQLAGSRAPRRQGQIPGGGGAEAAIEGDCRQLNSLTPLKISAGCSTADVDLVLIARPDHWHALPTVEDRRLVLKPLVETMLMRTCDSTNLNSIPYENYKNSKTEAQS